MMIQGQYMGLLRFTPCHGCAKKIILEKTSNEIDKIDFTSLYKILLIMEKLRSKEYLIKESGVNSILKRPLFN